MNRVAWIGFVLAWFVDLVLKWLHRRTPTVEYYILVVEMTCATILIITESASWWQQHRRGGLRP